MAVYKFNKDNVKRTPGVQTLGDAIQRAFKAMKIEQKFDETYLIAHWERVIGKPIASRTESIHVRDGVLFLKLNSAPLAQELVIAKTKLIKRLNDEFGYELINDIVFG